MKNKAISQIKIKITIRLLSLLFGIKPKITWQFINYVSNLRQASGLPFCIRYMKSVRLHITRYICGKPLLVNKDLVSLTNGFPTNFLYLKEFIDSNNYIKIRGVLTLLYYTRSIIPNIKEEKLVKPNLSSINEKYKGKEYSIPLYFIKEWVKNNNFSKDLPKYDGKLHYISSKGSPFGKATITGPFALFYMVETSQKMLQYFINLIGEDSYNNLFGNFIKLLIKDHRLMTPGKVIGSLGKISIVKDPELKRRPIAMLDYNSQLLLRPIHDDLLNNLSKLSQDRTFTQNPHNKWTTRGNKFWSLDLSSATDRFPIKLQEKLISVIYDNWDFAKAWSGILIDRDFYYEGKYLRYSVGQPMGAYSSWAAFTLSHHLVVAWCAYLCGIRRFTDYIILGDDIVINNDKVARKYISVMTKLGVDISLQKTHVSRNTYEFAKRWIKNRIEISPLPLKGILCNYIRPQVVLQQLLIYMHNNTHNFNGTVLELVIKLYTNLKIGKRYFTSYSINKIVYDFYYILRYALKLSSNEELRYYLISKGVNEIFICNEKLIPSFMRELIILGLGSQAEKAGNEIKNQATDFINLYSKLENFEIRSLASHPLVHGLYNKSLVIKNKLHKAISSNELDLIDVISSMRVENVDRIVMLRRDPSITVKSLDKLWKESLKILNRINFENFHNYPYPTCGQSTNYYQWEQNFNSNLSISADVLELLRYGHYNDPAKSTYVPMW